MRPLSSDLFLRSRVGFRRERIASESREKLEAENRMLRSLLVGRVGQIFRWLA
jgi:hypothetical protein